MDLKGFFYLLNFKNMKNVYYLIEITKHHYKENDMRWYSVIYSNGFDLIDIEYQIGEAIPTIILR